MMLKIAIVLPSVNKVDSLIIYEFQKYLLDKILFSRLLRYYLDTHNKKGPKSI
jgi:hypothetical protein